MYIIKNALRCIGRSKGRSILIGIIALVIAVSACIGLSIRQASESAKESALAGMSVTATISYDRAGAMGQMAGGFPGMGGSDGGKGSFDRNEFANMMGSASSLTLEEYKKYAGAKSVNDFYYTMTAYFNGSEGLSPVSDEGEEEDKSTGNSSFPSGFPGMGGMGDLFASGDFSVIGYSSDNAMTAFVNGTASVLEGGAIFEEGTSAYHCVISEELALYNGLNVNDTIVITNPSLESETYTLTITGIYSNTENNNFSMSMFGKSQDPANQIYMSATALEAILDASSLASTTVTDDEGNQKKSEITGTISATYVFANADDYYAFEEEVHTMGLSDSYTVSSSDIAAFDSKLAPLNTLSTMASWFLLVILIIGGVILVVLNIFNVRERKYEVGVLTAMGMKKWKVATQFMCEILAVTMIAVVIGAGIGAVSSVPVTNALLEGQVASKTSQQEQMEQSFGRPGNGGFSFPGGDMSNIPDDFPESGGGMFQNMLSNAGDYITEVNSAMNLTVVLQMIGIGLLLTLVASAASVLFIMRYDPLKILANRD